MPADGAPDGEYPLQLDTWHVQHQRHTLTKTGRVAQLNKLNPGPFIEIAAEDAERLGLKDQNPVEIRSRRGSATLPVRISSTVAPGTCFAPFHWNDRFGTQLCLNELTTDQVDPISLQPGIKQCAGTLTAARTPRSEARRVG